METLFDIFSVLSHQSVQFAINAVWLGLALTGLAWLLLRWTGHVAAGARVGLWWGMLVIVLGLPLLAISPPINWQASDPARSDAASVESQATDEAGLADKTTITDPNWAVTPARAQPKTPPVTPPAAESVENRGALALRLIPLSLALLWLAGLLVLVTMLGIAYRRMTAIKAKSDSFDIAHLPLVGRLLDRSPRRKVAVRLSHDTAIPVAAGLGRPMILIPHRLAETMSDTELEAVILHELAHLNRWDDWSKLAQKLVEAVCFFHPAVHIIGHQLELERELACDEWAIAQTGKVDCYTRCLTRLVQLTAGSATTLIPGALSNRKQIFRRFERLLLQSTQDSPPRRASLKLAALIAVVAATALFAVQLVPAIGLPMTPVTFAELQGPDEQDEKNQENQENEAGKTEDTELEGAEATRTARSTGSKREPTPTRTIGTAYVDGDRIYGATRRANRDRSVTHMYIDDDAEIAVETRGLLELTDDNRGIISLSPDGLISVYEETDDYRHDVAIEVDRNGKLVYTYRRDDQTEVFDVAAQRWLAGTLELMARETGLVTYTRMRTFIADGDLEGALTYIAGLDDDDRKVQGYELLIDSDQFGKKELRLVRKHAREHLDSDTYRLHIRPVYRDRSRRSSRSAVPPVPAASYAPAGLAIPAVPAVPPVPAVTSTWSVGYDDARATDYDSEGNFTTYVNSRWSGRGDHYDTEGEWEARYSRSRNRVQLEMEGYDRGYRIGFPVLLADLEGLTREQITDGADEVVFSYKRGSGTFHFTGGFGRGRGRGEFTFEADPEYAEAVKALGYRTTRLTDRRLFELAIHDVSLDYIQAMSELGLGRLRLDKLVEMRIHDIEPEFVAEFADLGYDRLSADDLIAFAIHDVDPGFVRELSDLNVRGLDQEAIVQLSIHDIDADFVREFAEIGYDGLSIDQLVQFGIHDVDPELVRELKALNVRGLDEDAMVQLSIHGIDANFVREFAEIGYDGLSIDQLVQFGIHGVDPDLVRELSKLDIRGLDEEAFVQLTIHGIDADFIRDFVEIGYDRLSADRLVEFGIHDVTARYVEALAELGYDDISPGRLVEMRIHDVTPSFIRRLQKRGYDDLSPAELIEARIHGYF